MLVTLYFKCRVLEKAIKALITAEDAKDDNAAAAEIAFNDAKYAIMKYSEARTLQVFSSRD